MAGQSFCRASENESLRRYHTDKILITVCQLHKKN
jgi:hypothetical protein